MSPNSLSFDPKPGDEWEELLPDYQGFPCIDIHTRPILREIRCHPKLSAEFKKRWIIAIASIFEEENIQDIIYEKSLDLNTLDSKIHNAEKSLTEARSFADENDRESCDIDTENKLILYNFEKYLRSQNRRINSNK